MRVVADFEAAYRKKLEALGELVRVEHDHFVALAAETANRADFLAATDRVLLSFLGARIVVVTSAANRNVHVSLLDMAEHLLIERAGEWLQIFGRGLGVRVFGFQVADHLGVAFFAKPEVRVVHLFPVPDRNVLDLLGHWCA